MKLIGTKFQIKVWEEITKIPKGKTKTYKEIAVNIGHPNSARAVANACGKNPYPIIIPCHRVIRSDGKTGGYSGPGGASEKKKLLGCFTDSQVEKHNGKLKKFYLLLKILYEKKDKNFFVLSFLGLAF